MPLKSTQAMQRANLAGSTPGIAVIIPAYNAAATLAGTLESILAQSRTDFEVVVTDDGSTDDTYEIASTFSKIDQRFKVVRQSNSGLADARNSGIRHTKAPLIAALDADDIWHPTYLERLSSALQQGGREAVMAYANSRIIDMQDRLLRNAPAFRYSGWVFDQLLLRNFIGNGSAMMFRRDVALQVGAYERRLHYEFAAQGCEDWLLALRLAACGRVVAVPEYLVGYRAVPGAMSENALQLRHSRLSALQVLFSEFDCEDSTAARWARGTAHAKCFLHELRSFQLGGSLHSLMAALRFDFAGTWRLLLGTERFNWLAGRLPQQLTSARGERFHQLDPLEGQWEDSDSRLRRARSRSAEEGPVGPRLNKAPMAEAKT